MSRRLALLISGILLVMVLPAAAQQPDEPLPPRVMSIQPLPGVPVLPDEAVTITFNQPMKSATLAFEPEVAGSITWANVMPLTVTPDQAWPMGVNYAVTLRATGESGVDLAEPMTFDLFGPPPLTITTVSPDPDANTVDVDTSIVIGFDRPMVPLGQRECSLR